jgi:hypothetical protein
LKKDRKGEAIAGLSIPQVPNALQFRTKAKTLVATGYESVQLDDDGVVRVYFTDAQVYQRNLVEVESAGGRFEMDPRPARYSSRDSASVEFLRPFSLSLPSGHWKAAASDLYVDGVPVFRPAPELRQKETAQIRQVEPGG